MKILLFGSNGQIGAYLQKFLVGIGEINACSRKDCDFVDLSQIENTITKFKPNIIVNAAAYTNVDKAESEKQKVKAINVDAIETIVKTAKNLGALLVDYSSDYIFDGTKNAPYVENDKANPMSTYGLAKFQGEEKIRKSGCDHLIFRTSWIYSPSGRNFVNTIIGLAREKDKLSIVDDQIGAPTSAEFVAQVTAHCIRKGINSKNLGTYHLTAGNSVSWYEFAKYILNYLKSRGFTFRLDTDNIVPVSSEEYKSDAIRPKNSVLNTDLIRKTFELQLPSWETQVEQVLSKMKLREMDYTV